MVDGFYSCFFLIDNIYKDLYNDLIIYAYGNEKVNYIAWLVDKNEMDYYSIDLDKLNFKTKIIEEKKIYLKINKTSQAENTKYILIKIQSSSSSNEALTILSNFNDNNSPFSPPINIFSYHLIYLYDDEKLSFDFEKIVQKQYRFLINNIYGNGEIQFEPDSPTINQYNTLISGNRTLSYIITKELNNIIIYNNQENNIKEDNNELILNIKIVYEVENSILEEIYFNHDYNGNTKSSFPMRYFLRDLEYEGSDINLQFYFNISSFNEKDLIINGYAINYDIMKLINRKSFIPLNFGKEIKGKFDVRTNHGLVIFEKKYMNNSDCYYLIEIDIQNNYLSNITMDIYAASKNSSKFSMPLNKYISGSFDLNNNQKHTQRYSINDVQDNNNKEFIIEFSSNYRYLNLVLSDNLKHSMYIKRNAGVTKYFVNITKNSEENYFDITINRNISENEKILNSLITF